MLRREKRRHKRVDVRWDVTVFQGDVGSDEAAPVRGWVTNVSTTGMCICLPVPFYREQRLRLSIVVDGRSFTFVCQVRGINEVVAGTILQYLHGTQIIVASTEAIEALSNFVMEHSPPKPGGIFATGVPALGKKVSLRIVSPQQPVERENYLNSDRIN